MANSEWRDLPQELVEEILTFLPVKYLLRFRCLSKSWRDTISSPRFCLSARRRPSVIVSGSSISWSPPFLHLIEGEKEGLAITITPWSDFDLPTFLASYITDPRYYYYFDKVLTLGSYKGLLLLGHAGYIFLLNPSTRQCTKIAPYRMYYDYDFVCSGGMCYDPSNNDYQFVLAIEPMGSTSGYNVRVTSFKAQTLEEVEFPYKGIATRAGVVVDEKIHWLVYTRERWQLVLVSFDATNKEFMEVAMPDHPEFCENICGLGVLDGCLAMSSGRLCAPPDERHLIYYVWVMKEYGVKESWTLLLTMEIPPRDFVNGEAMCCKPLFITSYGEVVINLGPRKMIIAYDLKNHHYREIVLPGEGSFIRCTMVHEESLFFPSSPTPRSL